MSAPTTEDLDALRSRIDIVELLGEYVELTERGESFTGLCPFCSTKTPSFNVRRDRGFFHCFGCQTSGDVFEFLQRVEGLTLEQSVQALSARAVEVTRVR